MKKEDLVKRIDHLITKANIAIAGKKPTGMSSYYVDEELYAGFKAASLSFIANLYGYDHVYYIQFTSHVSNSLEYNIRSGINILIAIKDEIEHDWLISITQLITADVFSDFLEMSRYFLDEKYKDPAAVMIGSVLEEHLRFLCNTNSIDITYTKGTDITPKKADVLNADLTKAGIYNKLEQKSITAWLDLRNKAAHGHYGEYTMEQVELMYSGVLNFVTSY